MFFYHYDVNRMTQDSVPPNLNHTDEFIRRMRCNAWLQEVAGSEFLGDAPTMLTSSERKMLHWLAREISLAPGATIVDAGCFLGGSTLALATGLAKNINATSKEKRIHTYDMFIAPRDQFSLEMIGGGRAPGDSIRDLFDGHVLNFKEMVVVHEGDFICAEPLQSCIDILFVDLAKTWNLNDNIIKRFFPKLVPGKSILLQQDYNDQSCPWINLTMEYFSEFFEVVTDDSATRTYICKSAIPEGMIRKSLEVDLSYDQKLSLMHSATSNAGNPTTEFFNVVTTAWIIFEEGGVRPAAAYLENVRTNLPPPWPSDYTEMVIRAMEAVGDVRGLRSYHDNFFVRF